MSLSISQMIGTCLILFFLMRWGLPAAYGYFAHTLPAFSVLVAVLLKALWEKSRIASAALAALLVTTNMGEIWLPWLCNLPPDNRHFPSYRRSYLGAYLCELTHRYKGPVDRLAAYVNTRSRPGEAAFISYEAEPFIFHTDLRILREIPFPAPPRFIILHQEWGANYEHVLTQSPVFKPTRGRYVVSWQRADSAPVTESHRRYIENYLRQRGYVSVRLPPSDTFRQNSPELRKRFFEPPDVNKEVTLWELRPPASN